MRKAWGHPCRRPLLLWLTQAAIAVAVIAGGAVGVGVLLVIPIALQSLGLAEAIARGAPVMDEAATARLVAGANALAGTHPVALAAATLQASPARLRRRARPPLLIAAADLVAGSDDAGVRGVAALLVAELADPGVRAAESRLRAAFVVLVALVAAGAFLVVPHGVALAAACASVGFSSWIATALAAVATRSPRARARLGAVDRGAAALAPAAGDVPQALLAMAAWRERRLAARTPMERLGHAFFSPLPPQRHERERAAALSGRT